MLVSCPDRHGLVAALARFLTAHDANIVHAEQHRDSLTGLFFQRMQFNTSEMPSDRGGLEAGLCKLARQYRMQWKLYYGGAVRRLAIFVSKAGHCLYDLVLRQRAGELRCEIPLIISNHACLRPVAAHFGIPFRTFPLPQEPALAERRQLELLRQHRIDLVVLARYMQLLSPAFVAEYPERIINIHHSFLPAFAGGRPYHQALQRGVKLIGATSHYVTASSTPAPSSSRTWCASRTAMAWTIWSRAAGTWRRWSWRAPSKRIWNSGSRSAAEDHSVQLKRKSGVKSKGQK